jgi:predicted Rossmann fold flavoprotein
MLLEGSRACGLKILVSGGGRCNVLPSEFALDDFFTAGSKNVLRRLFRTWQLADVQQFFEDHLGVPLVVEEETGKVFPQSQNARDIRDALVAACLAAGARLQTDWRVKSIEVKDDATFAITNETGESIASRRVVMATGGQSLPKTGSDGAGYGFVRQLGHRIVTTYPALVPLTTDDPGIRELTGISLPVRWRAVRDNNKVMEERTRELLFTHRGVSGPSILDASHWSVREGAAIHLRWQDLDRDTWQARWNAAPRQQVVTVVSEVLPRRLARLLCERARIPAEMRCSNMRAELRDGLLDLLCNFELPVTGNAGYGVAEVTGGGVPLDEVHPSTLESRKTPGLYLCGEILDVIGRIGGYNFLWAWVTGRLAGESAGRV